MALEFTQEVQEQFDRLVPVIAFFSLPVNQQIKVLPVLEKEQKYDFPDGDVVTSNALEVLIAAYHTGLNSFYIRLIIMLDECRNQELENLESLTETLLTTAYTIEEHFEEIGNIESLEADMWNELQRLSQMLQQQLEIELEVDTTVLTNFIHAWIHA